MEAIKNHWVTALALIGTTFLIVVGIALIVTGGDYNEAGVRVVGVAALLGAGALVCGLQGLRGGRPKASIANALIVVGMLVLGVGFFWFVLLPSIVAVLVLYAGVFRKGLERELSPT